MNYDEAVGAAIDGLRNGMRPKMTQKQLAAKVPGMTEVSLQRYEAGVRSMKVPQFWDTAKALGVEPHELLALAQAKHRGAPVTPQSVPVARQGDFDSLPADIANRLAELANELRSTNDHRDVSGR